MSVGFDAGSLVQGYAFLEGCPESLFADLVTFPSGRLEERVAGMRAWRAALLEGRLPPEDVWPPPELSAPARAALAALELPRFCRGQAELVDRLLVDILNSFAANEVAFRAEVASRLRELADLERQKASRYERKLRRDRRLQFDASALRRLEATAMREVAARQRTVDAQIMTAWSESVRCWADISEVFGDLGQLLGRGWDLSSAVIRHVGWMEILRLRQLLEKLPHLREIVRQLGRLHSGPDGVAEKIFVPVSRIEQELREVRTPFAPHEVRGIVRSGEVSRMLPSEASLLGHPRLKLLWHARRAERTLLSYQVEGVDLERVEVKREGLEERPVPRRERGPIVAVLDTSGSMHGAPELVAKAVVLEAFRTALAEKRRCLLYDFGGAGEVRHQELSLTPDGLGELMTFLSRSFGGGTDLGVMKLVSQQLKRSEWRLADVLLVTDGEWPVDEEVVAEVTRARESGCRFHGVQIGNRGQTGLHSLCDPVHVFDDWSSLGGENP